MSKIFLRRRFIKLAFLAIMLVFIFMLTNPYQIPLTVYLIPFGLMAIFFYLLTDVIIRLVRKKKPGLRTKVISIFISAIPTLLLLLQSIGQLTIRDFLIGVAIVTVAIFYFSRASFIPEATYNPRKTK